MEVGGAHQAAALPNCCRGDAKRWPNGRHEDEVVIEPSGDAHGCAVLVAACGNAAGTPSAARGCAVLGAACGNAMGSYN